MTTASASPDWSPHARVSVAYNVSGKRTRLSTDVPGNPSTKSGSPQRRRATKHNTHEHIESCKIVIGRMRIGVISRLTGLLPLLGASLTHASPTGSSTPHALSARAERILADIELHKIDDVRGHLSLPTSLNGLPISWNSSHPDIVGTDGRVKRQLGDAKVTLTATIDAEGVLQSRRIDAIVRRQASVNAYEGYAFAYFTGSSLAGENIFFAASNGNDALSWKELNAGQPVLKSSYGTKGLRDPFIIRSHEGDTFYLLATDLSIGSAPYSRLSCLGGQHVGARGLYDDTIGEYVVFWASSIYAESDTGHAGNTYHRMLYATTRDFVTFSETQVWQDAGTSRIDSTILEDNGVYYRFSKDEGAGGTGCSDIIQEESTNLRATLDAWRITDSCIGRNAGTSAVEGPTAFKSNPGDVRGERFYLFVDEYGGRGYIPLETADISNPAWKVSSSYSLPRSPRHGTVIPVTAAELSALTSSLSIKAKRQEASSAADTLSGSPVLPDYYADPNIAIFNQTYYIYATTDGFPGWGGKEFYVWNGHNPVYNRKTIGVAVADSPDGPFTAQPEAMILNNEAVTTGQAIDPAAFHDPVSGKYYFFWGNGSPIYAELADDMVTLKEGTIQKITGLNDFREGIFVGYATSTSVNGPWTYRGVVLEKDASQGILATGHSSIVNVPGTDNWYIAYHRFAIPDGDGTHRVTSIDKVTFGADGFMQKITPTLTGVEAEVLQ
ncbi:unnamed protein product [Parascedosporium putredinis]|uniref:Endo-1,5-alpha-L-arabinanase A n=1 Tax=Parascedosporium putredinis TaxID=1442378 RepID=A0A9P1H5B2_9PEZI|nr:unnamed protein product [Parascedosporium putredinis]CAI7996743.1 unnamed protein product [Parascedosporium putredinis]